MIDIEWLYLKHISIEEWAINHWISDWQLIFHTQKHSQFDEESATISYK